MARKAFIVAIDNYPSPYALNSQINDKNDLVNTLVKYYSFTSVTTLLNSAATKAAIISKLKAFIKSGVSGDSLVFAFMGHGSHIASSTELDGYIECICPYDVLSGKVITDSELKTILSYKPSGVNLDVIISCCYSAGSTTNNSNISLSYGTISDTLIRKVAPINIIPESVIKNAINKYSTTTVATTSTPSTINHVLWAACGESQLAWTVTMADGSERGLFPLYLCYALRNYKTYVRQALGNLVCSEVSNIVSYQTPQILGTSEELSQLPFT